MYEGDYQMRYFSEKLEGEQIKDPDFVHGSVTSVNNKIRVRFIIESEEKAHYEEVYANNATGGAEYKRVIDEPVKGKWHIYDNRGGVERDITDVVEGVTIPKHFNIYNEYESNEVVGIYHKFSAKEQKEHDDKQAEIKAENQKAAIIQDCVHELPSYESDTDKAVCELYEMITTVFDNDVLKLCEFKHSAIAKAYARRILNGEITLDDVPEQLIKEVKEILEENKK